MIKETKKSFFSPSLELLKQLGIVALFLMLGRILFHTLNIQSFTNVGFKDYIAGFYFDCITISLVFLPYSVIYFLPLTGLFSKIKNYTLRTYYILSNSLLVALNLLDCEYFKYTFKRSTVDAFQFVTTGNDMNQLAGSFLLDFWYLLFLLIFFLFIIFRITKKFDFAPAVNSVSSTLLHYVCILPIFILIGRGGIQLKPVGIVEAAKFAEPEHTALVLNTPFTLIKSYGKQELELKKYYSEAELNEIFRPTKNSNPQNILPKNTNVVIILLESFGNEHVGFFNHSESFTPFFDSILGNSLTFEYGLANGKKSIEAVPAILASIPSMMNNPYISSPYGNNRLKGLPSILKEHGYSTHFFHGATNGSMRFDAFTKQLGVEHYYGRHEYNNDAHFDKTWGILDEYFNPWTSRQLSKVKQPFLATLFTLSSHHPYFIPEHRKKQVKQGNHPICASIHYGDIALRLFFEEAQKQPWYENTIFVLVADHTPATNNPKYSDKKLMYRIPIAFYDPLQRIKTEKRERIFQQIDIMPTLLDLLQIKTRYYAFGNSLYDPSPNFCLNYLEGTYYFFQNKHLLTYSNETARNLQDFSSKKWSTTDSLPFYKKEVKRSERLIKAVIQRYNEDLMRNKTIVE